MNWNRVGKVCSGVAGAGTVIGVGALVGIASGYQADMMDPFDHSQIPGCNNPNVCDENNNGTPDAQDALKAPPVVGDGAALAVSAQTTILLRAEENRNKRCIPLDEVFNDTYPTTDLANVATHVVVLNNTMLPETLVTMVPFDDTSFAAMADGDYSALLKCQEAVK